MSKLIINKSYLDGVKDGFNAGIKKSIEIISLSLNDYCNSEKKSSLNKANITIFCSNLMIKLNQFINNESKPNE